MTENEFKQPSLTDADEAFGNIGKTDELSLAAAAAFNPVHEPPAPEPQPMTGKYCLDYVYNNQSIHETHHAVRNALARIADLKRLGIVAKTSTQESRPVN